jgi:DNA mismatch repair protein MutL
MPTIRILPPEIVNRIAAGEVVERPASVLKELVENAIDASATEVIVDLEEGGKSLLRVRDNGCGMAPEDLPLAFASHATSKLAEEDIEQNLLGVGTLGFRGEALASIASVARVEIVSRQHGAEHAYRYRPGANGAGEPPAPAAGEAGTTLEVRSLFYNTPARRKFLRSTGTELSHCVEQMTRLGLGFPGVRMLLAQAGKKVLDLPACSTLKERLRQLVGKDLLEELLEVRRPGGAGAPSITGFVSSPRLHRGDARAQHFFVNGRWVRDRMLSHALRSAFQGFQIPGRQPFAYLFIDLAPAEVDVNVHPTKTEVRFRESSDAYRLVHRAVRDVLEAQRAPEAGGASTAAATTVAGEAQRQERLEEAVLEFIEKPPAPLRVPVPAASRRDVAPSRAAVEPQAPASRTAAFAGRPAKPARQGCQVLQSYILLEDEEGLVLIDQHAFHEKILFEEIHRRLEAGALEMQRLLVPDVLELPPALMPLIEEAAEALEPFGFDLAVFGPTTAAIHGFPALLDRGPGRVDPAALVRSVLESLRGDGGPPSLVDPLAAPRYRIASTLACKRAVKAGTPLSDTEIAYLLERGELAQDPRHCPHGRPTTVRWDRKDIERDFDRK